MKREILLIQIVIAGVIFRARSDHYTKNLLPSTLPTVYNGAHRSLNLYAVCNRGVSISPSVLSRGTIRTFIFDEFGRRTSFDRCWGSTWGTTDFFR